MIIRLGDSSLSRAAARCTLDGETLACAEVGTTLRSCEARVREVKRALGYALDWPELKVV